MVRVIKFFLAATLALGALLAFAQKPEVEKLEFKGNEKISAGALRGAIKTKANPWYDFLLFWIEGKLYDEEIFLTDLLRIEKFYHQEGFLQARVTDYRVERNDEKNQVKIVVFVEEGEPAAVTNVEFLPSNGVAIPLTPEELLRTVTLKNGKRYREQDLRRDYDQIVDRLSNLGFPYVKPRVKPVFDEGQRAATLEWYIAPGPFSVFGDIEIMGNKSVSDKLIRTGLDFKTGERFAPKKLQSSQTQIYRLQLFEYVSLRAGNLEQQPAEIPIEIEVKERKIRTLELGVGYGSEESFRVSANLTHRNFFGGARILRLEAKRSRLLPVSVELEFLQPFFLDNQNDLVVKPFWIWQNEKSFEARRLGFETTLNRQLDLITNAFTTVRIERDSVRVKAEQVAEETENLYNKSIFQLGVRWNNTNQLFNPTQGYIAKLVGEESGALLQSAFRYYKFSGEYRDYRQLQPNLVLASRLALGAMNPFRGSAVTPVEERFFSGGSYSVRGWARHELGPHAIDAETGELVPTGGNSLLEGSFELRYPLFWNFSGATFLDYGNVWEEWLGFDLNVKYALGLGLRYHTPVGPFRLDVARKLNKQSFDGSDFQIHLSIGQAF